MNIYVVDQVIDNPLYEGLAMTEQVKLLETWPDDWRTNYKTWKPKTLADEWPSPRVLGNVRRFNDYPCINLSFPAFSQRAVDLIYDLLSPNGELLPVVHKIGTYYFYNCLHMTNCVDLTQSKVTKLKDGIITSVEKLAFIDELLQGLTIFKIRTQLMELFCSQVFVDRVQASGLEGFAFKKIWPLPEGVTFFDEMHRVNKACEKWKPKGMAEINIKANTLIIRLYCDKKKPNKNELASVNTVVSFLEESLYDPNQHSPESYFGNIEGSEILDCEVRIFLSAPDCDRLISFLMPKLRILPWPGKYHVVKKRENFVETLAKEEYVSLA